MPKLSPEAADKYLRRLKAIAHRGAMRSGWDVNFVDDMIVRLSRDGATTNITPRQWEQLERILDRYGETVEADQIRNPYPYADRGGRNPFHK